MSPKASKNTGMTIGSLHSGGLFGLLPRCSYLESRKLLKEEYSATRHIIQVKTRGSRTRRVT